MKPKLTVACLLIALTLVSQCAFAQIPRTLSYQGILTDSTDHPKPDGNYAITFRLYDTESGGSALWTEAKTLGVKKGLFATELGDVTPFPAAVKFDKSYWLSMQVSGGSEFSPRLHLSSVAYSMTSVKADSTRIAGTVVNGSITNTKLADASVTTAKIADASIQCADLAQNGASEGQVLKWTSGAWAAAADATGGGSSGGGWTDNGGVIGLTTATDTVSLNTTARLGKLNLNGDIGLNGESGLYFGTRNSYLEATPGENLTLRANNDLKTYAGGGVTMLAADNINLGHLGETSWMKLDNTNKRVGIGMGTTDAVDDRLHVKNDLASNCWARIESAHPSSWGQAGLRIKTPQNTWHLRMDANGNANFPDGALSLYNSGGGAFETMTWLKDGKVGVGTKNPIRRLHVNGSAEIEDTLYAGTVKATNMIGGPGLVHSKIGWNEATRSIGSNTWVTFDSVTIQAPGPGYVLLLLSASLETNHTFYYDDTHVRMAIAKTRTGGDKLGYCDWAVPLDLPSAYYKTPAALNAVAYVASAGSYEYFAGGHNWLGADDQVFWTESFFTALFIPASYGTVEAAPNDPPPPGDVTATAGRQRTTPESFESRLNVLTSELEALKREQASRGQ